MSAVIRHVIVDRDGVLNREDPDGWVLDPSAWHWEAGALEALRIFARAGVRVSVATNQSCVGRGMADRAMIDAVHQEMRAMTRRGGGVIDAVYVCPHVDADGCECRKPKPGLIRQAVAASGIVAEQTLFVGDTARDLEAARAAGVAAVLVLSGRGQSHQDHARATGVPVLADLHAVARAVAAGEPIRSES